MALIDYLLGQRKKENRQCSEGSLTNFIGS